MKFKWSDGEPMTLEPGQVWTDPVNGEDDVIIDEVVGKTGTKVFWHNPHEAPRTNWNFADGVDGFVDFLETCCYKLKV